MSALGDRLIRGLGADPHVFRPIARAHSLILRRSARLSRQRSGWLARHIPPFYFLCFIALVTGAAVASIALVLAPPLLGAALAFTFGATFLLLVIILDDFDVLVNPTEYLVVAPHPHDGWSVLLAKVVVVGRSIVTVAAFHFTPGALILAFVTHSALAGIGFMVGAALLTAAVASGGMLFAAALLALWGRRALDRLLPLVQGLYMVAVLFSAMGRQAMRHVALPTLSQTGVAQWAVPAAWFVWPVEVALGQATSASWVRVALSSGSLVLLAVAGARWIGGRFGERLLDPPAAPRRPTAVKARADSRRWSVTRLVAKTPESRAVLKLWAVHLRSDLQFRSNLMATAVTPLVLLGSLFLSRSSRGIGGRPEFVIGIVGFGLTVMMGSMVRILSMSSRPEAIWCVLTSPASRSRFSFSTVSAIRTFLVFPCLVLVTAVVVSRQSGSPWTLTFTLLGLALLLEAVLRFWRGVYRDMPFSTPLRSAGKMGGAQVLTMFGGMVVSAGAVGALLGAPYLGAWAPWAAAAVLVFFVALLVLAAFWSRWRVTRAADAFEITPA